MKLKSDLMFEEIVDFATPPKPDFCKALIRSVIVVVLLTLIYFIIK